MRKCAEQDIANFHGHVRPDGLLNQFHEKIYNLYKVGHFPAMHDADKNKSLNCPHGYMHIPCINPNDIHIKV